jgi:signal transduction histidine kinase/HD-like signal output (HDOD) protein
LVQAYDLVGMVPGGLRNCRGGRGFRGKKEGAFSPQMMMACRFSPKITPVSGLDMINKENVYRQIMQSGSLPTLPEILYKLIEDCDHSGTPQSEIAAIISKDPALTFKVLQRVNSSPGSGVMSIKAAVAALGIDSIKRIAITASVQQIFAQKKSRPSHFRLDSFWRRSLLCAILAGKIAKRVGFDNLEEAYLSGLLHDIGRLALVSAFPKEHEWFLFETENVRNELWAETRLIGTTHCEAGAWLVDAWRLDSLMGDALRFHHGPLERIQDAFPLVKITYLATLLRENDQDRQRNCTEAELLLGLNVGDLQEITEESGEEVSQIAKGLNIEASSSPPAEKSSQGIPEEVLKIVAAGGIPEPPPQAEETETAGGAAAQSILAERVKSTTILSGVLEDLIHAGDSEAVISTFEQSLALLFNLTKVLFFLPDREGRLQGRASISNSLRHLSRGLVLPVQESSSLIVQAYREMQPLYLTVENSKGNLADGQMLRVLRCVTILLIPLAAEKRPAGVILLGIPRSMAELTDRDSRLIKMIAEQVGLCLHLEEVKREKAREEEAERMAGLSMMARKFAHEISNPLGIITNCLTAMGMKFAPEDGVHEDLRIIGEEISRISSMVGNVNFFSKDVELPFERIDVNAVLEDIIRIVKAPLFTELGMDVSFRPEPGLPGIVTSGHALKQIMLNLLKNSSEAMGRGDMVEIRTALIPQTSPSGDIPEGGGVEITVEDTGPGLPESVMKSLYKPFVTTKKHGHSGLGLAIVSKAVKDLGGSISCASIPEEGTRFSIYLPLEKNDFSA